MFRKVFRRAPGDGRFPPANPTPHDPTRRGGDISENHSTNSGYHALLALTTRKEKPTQNLVSYFFQIALDALLEYSGKGSGQSEPPFYFYFEGEEEFFQPGNLQSENTDFAGGGGGFFGTMVAPVGAANTSPVAPMAASPVAMHIARNAVVPLFSPPVKENWDNHLQAFRRYVDKLSPGNSPTDEQLLHLFEQSLPKELQNELYLLQAERKGKVTFNEFLGVMNVRFGGGGGEMARKRWMATPLKHDGQISTAIYRDFVCRFKWNMREVPNVSGQEAKRVILGILPQFFNRWMVEEEQKKNANSPVVDMKFPRALTDSNALEVVRQVGEAIPKKFERLSTGKYRVICDGMMMAQKLLQHNGRRILPFDGYVEAEKIPYEMSFEEMLIYFEGKLITREMIGETKTFNGKGRRLREMSAVEPNTAENSPK